MKLTTVKFDGIVNENRTGKDTWFNALCLLHPAVHKGKNTPWDVVFGDYSRFVDEEVVKANGIMQQLVRNLNFCCFLNFFFKIYFFLKGVMPKWKQGDMMIVDNRLALHSRNIFTPPRRILAAFA